MKPHGICLGDILRTLNALKLTAEDQERAAKLLGFSWQKEIQSKSAPSEQRVPAEFAINTDSRSTPPSISSKNAGLTPDWLERLGPIGPSDESKQPQLPPPDIDDRENEAWIFNVRRPPRGQTPDLHQRVKALPADKNTIGTSLQLIEPLFPPDTERSLLTSMLLRSAQKQDVDVSRLVRLIAGLEAFSKLPLQRRVSARGDVQVLLDQSTRMDPFVEDQIHIVKSLYRLLPDERLQVRYCQSSPPDEAIKLSRRSGYRYPPRGTLVLLISDLGQGGGLFAPYVPDPEQWVDFASRLAARGCDFLVLAPVSPDRIDKRLSRHLAIIPWDRRFSAAAIRAHHKYRGY